MLKDRLRRRRRPILISQPYLGMVWPERNSQALTI
jgi:hypothetical protein